jgi:hypothetical protein
MMSVFHLVRHIASLSGSSNTTGLTFLLVQLPIAAGEGLQAELDFACRIGIVDANNHSV